MFKAMIVIALFSLPLMAFPPQQEDEILQDLKDEFRSAGTPQLNQLRLETAEGWNCYARSSLRGSFGERGVQLVTRALQGRFARFQVTEAGAPEPLSFTLTRRNEGWVGRVAHEPLTRHRESVRYNRPGRSSETSEALYWTERVTLSSGLCVRLKEGGLLLEFSKSAQLSITGGYTNRGPLPELLRKVSEIGSGSPSLCFPGHHAQWYASCE